MTTGTPRDAVNVTLAIIALFAGLACAAAYAAWRAISREGIVASARWSEFGEAMLFPGALIIAAVAAMVWLGWKANIDG
jgi:hypothetical protein